jgi:hypothetical protein
MLIEVNQPCHIGQSGKGQVQEDLPLDQQSRRLWIEHPLQHVLKHLSGILSVLTSYMFLHGPRGMLGPPEDMLMA